MTPSKPHNSTQELPEDLATFESQLRPHARFAPPPASLDNKVLTALRSPEAPASMPIRPHRFLWGALCGSGIAATVALALTQLPGSHSDNPPAAPPVIIQPIASSSGIWIEQGHRAPSTHFVTIEQPAHYDLRSSSHPQEYRVPDLNSLELETY